MLGDVLKDDGAETRLGTRVSGNNGKINRKSLEKTLDGVKTARLQLRARWIIGLCQREREHKDTWESRKHVKITDAQLQLGINSSVNT